ncbi:hypothetical protein [Flavobacterium poyangense]|uniref:hypothetical protein n=1 Tax=Flavobacterium poyangense TaxID=2204302 RepID=UPI00141EECDF|nr:hypothetical protein [Flavobacterium sp. JXAS1]
MRTKFYFLGLVLISLSMASCSNDELENEQVKSFKKPTDTFGRKIDSTNTKPGMRPASFDGENYGDPSNPKPPRH